MRPSSRFSRETPSRRIGVILSILFLASLGTVATFTSVPASSHAPADAIAALSSPAAR
jgi:hypothetical protein